MAGNAGSMAQSQANGTVYPRVSQGTCGRSCAPTAWHPALNIAHAGGSSHFISSDISYVNGSFSILNETLFFNSTYTRPITVFVNNSRLLIRNSILKINEMTGDYFYFLLTGRGSSISIVSSEIFEAAAVVSFDPAIRLNNTSLSVNHSIFLSTGEILNTAYSSNTYISGSYFSGNGSLINAENAGSMRVEGTAFSVNGSALHPSTAFRSMISVNTASRIAFANDSFYSLDENTAYGMTAGNVNSFKFFNSTFDFSGQNSSEPGFDMYGMHISNTTSLSLENSIVSGNEIAVSVMDSADLNFTNLKTNQSLEGLSLSLDRNISISYSLFYGGTYGLLISDSFDISMQNNYFLRTLFGMRFVDVHSASIKMIFEKYAISSMQIVDSQSVSVMQVYDLLVPYQFNFLEFYGITVAGSKDVTLDSVSMDTAPDSSGGFVDGLSIVYSNFTTVRNLHMLFSGQFVSTAVTLYNSANNSLTGSTVISEGTTGDTGLWIVNSKDNLIQGISLLIIGEQAVLLQNSTDNLITSGSISVDGASTSGLYVYNSWYNRFDNLTIYSEGYNAETGIVFQNSSFNSFSDTYVSLTGSLTSQALARSINSTHNSFRGFDYYSANIYLEWVAVSLALAFLSTAGLYAAVTIKPGKKIPREDRIRLKRIKL
jgi:hypothetical protein